MKNNIALILSLTLAFAHPTHCAKSMEEWGVCGLGVLTAYTGLKMLNNATGKDGTKTQAFLGTALFGSGLYMTFAGPRKVKQFHGKNRSFRSATGTAFDDLTISARKALAADKIEEQARRERGTPWKQNTLYVLAAAIKADPTGQLAKTFPWGYLIGARL